jgi:hypothetical protein
MNRFNGFYFDHKFSADQEVEPRVADDPAFELQHYWLLSFIWDVSQIKLNGERLFVNRFQESRTKNAMNFDSSTNYLVR